MLRFSALVLGLSLAPFSLPAHAQHPRHNGPKPTHTTQSTPLSPYTACHFDDGLHLSETLPLPPDAVGRAVETMHGRAHIPILRGERFFFSYPGTEPFAKVVVEQLPAGSFDDGRAQLISNFDQILASDNGTRNYALKPTLNGFAIYGLDRSTLQGTAVGVYLLLDDRTAIATTIYFLDADPASRRFSNIAEYTALRDRFLTTYTACIHPATSGSAPRSNPQRSASLRSPLRNPLRNHGSAP